MVTKATTKNTQATVPADPAVRSYVAGLDVGNGYTKGAIVGTHDSAPLDMIDMPSTVVEMTGRNRVPSEDATAPEVVNDDFVNNLDAQFTSPLVGDGYRRLFGVRSLSAKGPSTVFDLVGHMSKAEQQLSKVIVLGVIAAKAVKDYVSETGHLPDPSTVGAIRVHATVALALPINEFKDHRGSYAVSFTGTGPTAGQTHTVTVTNFDTPVTVHIVFDDVRVMAEGASAHFAIIMAGAKLMDGMLADVRSHGLALEGVTSADLTKATNVVGVDIGEGTVNFPVFTSGKFNTDASRTLPYGYGTVLEDALEAMEAAGVNTGIGDRKQLAEFLQHEPGPLKRKVYDRVKRFVDEQALFFVRQITQEFAKVLSDVGIMTEVAYVYGGGSGPMRDVLYQPLLDKVTEINGEDAFPVLYLDSRYSRTLNREGLLVGAKMLVDKK